MQTVRMHHGAGGLARPVQGASPVHEGIAFGLALQRKKGPVPSPEERSDAFFYEEFTRSAATSGMPRLPGEAHVCVPVRLNSGHLYGTLCCFRQEAEMTLGDRELKMMRAFADVLANQIEESSQASVTRAQKVDQIQRAIVSNSPRIVYQPIYHLDTGWMAGVECLSRFDMRDPLSPSEWFELADEVGLRQELECAAIERSLISVQRFPSSTYLGINSSPQTILSGRLTSVLERYDLSRLVVEITEHAIVTDYGPLSAALQPLRAQGLRVAIDDAGAGYASMRHIISLLPDIIKLDMSLVRSIDTDPTRRAMARALISFSKEIGSRITAEGIQTQGELETLRQLGVDAGQGYLLKEPVSLDAVCQPELQCLPLRLQRSDRQSQ